MDDSNNSMVDDILKMYSSAKPFKIEMSLPARRQVLDVANNESHSSRTSQFSRESERDYIKEYKEKEDEEYLKSVNDILLKKNEYGDNMSEITELTEEMMRTAKRKTQIYETYNFAYRPKVDLPILAWKSKIVSMIASNSVIVIRGSTGCGKTTQVPQFIFDAEYEKKKSCNIIVTQPRRIAALSIAKRISQERDWPVGTLVGYQIGLIKNICEDTRITYCTTGVLLHKLINNKHMSDYTHIILDEIHERDENMDFLLLVVKKLLRSVSPMVKVILMSATIDVEKFAEYFSTPVENKLLPAPIIDIPQSSPYDVSIYYLNDLENLGNIPEICIDQPKFTFEMAKFCMRIIHIFDQIDKENPSDRPAVLVFLPGIYEIDKLRSVLLSAKHADKWDIIILHSLISTEEQENIFKKTPKDFRRIILSTNIAESSVTVPNVKYVIDLCMTKLLVNEPETNYQSLQLCWTSKANCQQRAGRTGRVMNGRVYRMVPREFYDMLREEALPEILRAPLANVVLKTKMLQMGAPKALLALSLDPPDLTRLQYTILLLKEAGALINKGGAMEEFDGDLTPLGHVMASLPLEIHVTKLIVLGYLFDVLQDAIIIAASISVREVFSINFNEMASTYQEKLHWAENSTSDCIAYLHAYKVWRNEKAHRRITNAFEERKWARERHLRLRSLREVDALVADITYKLKNFGIKELISKQPWESVHIQSSFIIKIVIAGAFYPNYFVKFPNILENEYRKQNIAKTLSFRDPMHTVVLQGWPLNQPGILYSRQFQEIFANFLRLKDPECITVSFDGSSRVYIEYEKENPDDPDYRYFLQHCIKMRHCKIPIKIYLLSETDARRRVEELRLERSYEQTVFCPANPSDELPCRRYMYDKKPYPPLPEESEYRSTVMLQGPSSPIEAQIVHLANVGRSKKATVDASSVNSVLIDPNPDNLAGIFLVAQTISQDLRAMRLLLRNTTLLPNTPGLAALITLIFTPYMELRRSPLGTYYTGALCGLGYDPSTGKSIYPEHDLEIRFDVEIDMKDLLKINKLRHWMNIAMHFNDGNDMEEEIQTELTINCLDEIKVAFNEVINRARKKQQPIPTLNFDKWNRYEENLFLEPVGETLRNNIYNLHKALELNKGNEKFEKMIKHVLELEILAHQDPLETSIPTVFCKLCRMEIYGIIHLRAHLTSEQHLANQEKIDTTDDFGEDLGSLLKKMKL